MIGRLEGNGAKKRFRELFDAITHERERVGEDAPGRVNDRMDGRCKL